MEYKICNKCLEEKPDTNKFFYKNGHGGLRNECKACSNEVAKAYRRTERGFKALQRADRKRSKCPKRKYYQKTYDTKRHYGIKDITILQDLLDQQRGICAICGMDFGEEQYHIDHCHDSGDIRGLLCTRCNTGIGLLREDKEIFKAAINYLEK